MRKAGWSLWSLGVAAFAYLAWLAFVGTFEFDECVLGIACALVAAAASLLTWRAMGLKAHGTVADYLSGWRVPWYILSDSWAILRVLALDLLGKRNAGSLFRVCPFEIRHSPRGTLRRVLAIVYSTAAPNSIVIGIDPEQGLMIFHQLAPSDIPKTARDLGACA